MRKVILTMLLALGLSVATHAQEVKRFNPVSMVALEGANATEEQKQKFLALDKEYKEKLKAIRSNISLSDDEKKSKHKELNGYRMKTYWNEILTPEQAKQIRDKQKALKEAANN